MLLEPQLLEMDLLPPLSLLKIKSTSCFTSFSEDSGKMLLFRLFYSSSLLAQLPSGISLKEPVNPLTPLSEEVSTEPLDTTSDLLLLEPLFWQLSNSLELFFIILLKPLKETKLLITKLCN